MLWVKLRRCAAVGSPSGRSPLLVLVLCGLLDFIADRMSVDDGAIARRNLCVPCSPSASAVEEIWFLILQRRRSEEIEDSERSLTGTVVQRLFRAAHARSIPLPQPTLPSVQ